MILYSHTITARLQYISDFIGNEISGKPIELTSETDVFRNYSDAKINYSNERISPEEIFIKPHSLLFEKNIHQPKINCFEINGDKAFFKTEGDLSFDVFAASFYLLSRYEEYLPHKKDNYGRYAFENSLAYQAKFLHLPLINIWLKNFAERVKQKFPLFSISFSPFAFIPTYDIDEAYSYKHKGFVRTAGGTAKQLINGKWNLLKERFSVLKNKKQDPYDSYQWMDELHEKYKLKPTYFFHVAAKNGKYDKNILPSQPAMQQLIKQYSEKYSIGIHPSWQSGDNELLLKDEMKTLENLSGRKITASRQHYIRFTLPETFRLLIQSGVKKDYSMGYGSINGFRASVASPFKWYDLQKEEQTGLELFPFCFMDANSFYEQKFSVLQALDEMRYYRSSIQSVNGTMITIWHNNFLGTEKLFNGWKEVYEQFLRETC
ncbi:MAG TPA: polysaccharide deacetylase family protein [Chitinophagaceae bacterium]|nr:polysaccharide deacetylase family protein [Chitinophagaceae bacterium]